MTLYKPLLGLTAQNRTNKTRPISRKLRYSLAVCQIRYLLSEGVLSFLSFLEALELEVSNRASEYRNGRLKNIFFFTLARTLVCV